ncbi:DUF4097 family beta strand repeat protein [Tumebacillus sp. ITR2]|uniref:DUF4097 family beta strand repeat protein n=1 Tax=Tumebacillus amylolyticus TaxID=2801339 RepID=A0ABS1JBT9_9BACL|nr:DUF4097 family beta strand repeat-containing protein [Tumebacillus amylolyticus]MBL0387088.1 DUF4097 family beta strand repeat protein [Tumebacillus amylolyticus]
MKRKTAMWMMGLAMIVMAGGLTGCDAGVFQGKQAPISQEKSFDGKDIQNISIESHSIDVHLIPSDGDKIVATVKGTLSENAKDDDKAELLNASVNGSQLVIVSKIPTSFMDYKGGSIKLDVQVPKKMYEGIKVEEHSGDIEMDAFQAKKFTVDTSSGDVVVHGFQGDDFNLTAHSGNMTLDQMTGKGTILTHSGDVKVSMAEVKKDISIETHSGNTALYLPEASVFRLDSVTKSADSVKLNFPLSSQKKDGDDHVIAAANNATDSAPLVKIDSSSGNLELGKSSN